MRRLLGSVSCALWMQRGSHLKEIWVFFSDCSFSFSVVSSLGRRGGSLRDLHKSPGFSFLERKFPGPVPRWKSMLRQYTPTPVRSAVNPVVNCGRDVAATLNDSSRETVIWNFSAMCAHSATRIYQFMCDLNLNWIIISSVVWLGTNLTTKIIGRIYENERFNCNLKLCTLLFRPSAAQRLHPPADSHPHPRAFHSNRSEPAARRTRLASPKRLACL